MSSHFRTRFGSILVLTGVIMSLLSIVPASAARPTASPVCNGIPNEVDGTLTVSLTDVNGGILLPGDRVRALATWNSTATSTTQSGSILVCVEVAGTPVYSQERVPPLDGDDAAPTDQTAQFTFDFTVGTPLSDVPGSVGDAFCGKALLTGTQAPGDSAAGQKKHGNCLTLAAAPTPQSDMTITKVDTVDPVTAPGNVTYTLTATNQSSTVAATNVHITDTLPTGLTFVSATPTPAGATCNSASPVDCDFGTVAASGVVSVQIVASTSGTTPASVSNTGNVTSGNDSDNTNNSDGENTTVTQPGTPQSDMTITKVDTVDPVTAPGNVTYTLTATNQSSTVAATNVHITDTLPTGLTFVSATPTPAGATCNSASPVDCDFGTVAASGVVSVQIVASTSGTTPASVSNTGNVTSGNDSDNTNNSDGETTAVNQPRPVAHDLQITKTDLPDPVVAGGNITYTITVSNPGPGTSANVTVEDTIPAGTTFVSATGGVTPVAGKLTFNIGNLQAGDSAVRSVVVTVDPARTTAVSNTATADSNNRAADVDLANNSATATTAVNPPPAITADVTVAKTGPASAQTGTEITYIVTATNNDTADTAKDVKVQDALPAGTTFVSGTWAGGTCGLAAAGLVECNLGDMAPSSSVPVTIKITAPANVPVGGKITNNASVGSTNEANANNNTATWDTDITAPVVPPCLRVNPPPSCFPTDPSADLVVTKMDDADPVTAGDDITYTISVTNNGPSAANGVTVNDTLPAGTTLVSATPSVGTCNATSPVSCSLGTLTSGQTATVTIVVGTGGVAPGTIENTGSATSTTNDPNAGNNTDVEPTTIVPPLAPEQGRIVIQKQTLPNRSSETFEFTGDLPATLGDGQTAVLDVDAGTYTATEVAEEGWELTGISCDDSDSTGDKASATATFEVAEGETVKCTFTNTEIEVLPIGPINRPDPDRDEDPSAPDQGPNKVLPAVKPGVLPFTGSDPSGLAALASLLMLSGAVLVLAGRGRGETAEVEQE